MTTRHLDQVLSRRYTWRYDLPHIVLESQVIAYNPATDVLSCLDPVATAVISTMDGALDLRAVAASLGRTYGVSADQLHRDVVDLVERLVSDGLVTEVSALDDRPPGLTRSASGVSARPDGAPEIVRAADA